LAPSALFVTTVPITLEAFLVPFAERFRSHGWRIDALANGATANDRIAGAFDNRYDISWSRNPLSPGNLLGTASKIREIVGQGRYDIVHVHTPIAAFVTRYALRDRSVATRPSVIYTAHGFHFYEGGSPASNFVYRRFERAAAPWTDFLVTINAEDYAAARDLAGIHPERVRYIPGIGVDTDLYAPGSVPADEVACVRTELNIERHAFMLTMIAEFGAVKRHEHLLNAFAHVKDPHAVLVLVGNGPLESTLREKAVALGLAPRIRWAGYRRDIPAVLAASDALVLCSEREGLNRSVLEAMAAGRPVIGTQTRGIADAVTPETGWIVPKHDLAALAAAIREAAANRDETARRGVAARERAVAEFALPRIIDAYEELYREALASRV
jgi:glycosyltransferase involved in cell wall biosynthesis